ncbi:MAG: hypothetical protein E6Q37_05730 [Crocinitomicaceae bacterium]|nr:MAG: hypothetical protein E6Q37_05730 [Crocinitomicaceae bacterium]
MKFETLNPASRVWLYQASKALTPTEMSWLQEELDRFTEQWAAHGNQLQAAGKVMNPFFIALAVDLTHENASGCSIDASVRFVKSVGNELNVDFFNRLKMWVEVEDGAPQLVSFKDLTKYSDLFVYNPLVEKLADLDSKFKLKVADFLAQTN